MKSLMLVCSMLLWISYAPIYAQKKEYKVKFIKQKIDTITIDHKNKTLFLLVYYADSLAYVRKFKGKKEILIEKGVKPTIYNRKRKGFTILKLESK